MGLASRRTDWELLWLWLWASQSRGIRVESLERACSHRDQSESEAVLRQSSSGGCVGGGGTPSLVSRCVATNCRSRCKGREGPPLIHSFISCEIVDSRRGHEVVEHGIWGSYDVEDHYQATTGEDIADWENFVLAVVNFRACESAIAL
jgi:hypothetical protein